MSNNGHKETRSNNACQRLSDKELTDIIKSGSLRHAAACYELERRGRHALIIAAKAA